MRRSVSTVLSPTFICLAFAAAAYADPPAEQFSVPSLAEQLRGQWTIEDVAPKLESRAYLETRDDTVERLSLREAVGIALENNPGIAVERLGPEFARVGIDLADGIFDPTFQATANVTLEARRAIGDVRSNSKRITATRLARELAQENLEQQKKPYDVGLATTKDILDFQSRVTAARASETQALIDYNVSLAALRQAEGTLLAQFDVVVDTLPPHPTPLWARF